MDTKEKLLKAALELFAEKGVGEVSMRMINARAGSKNASAAHYHFGSKLGIVQAVMSQLMDPMMKVISARLPQIQKMIVEDTKDIRGFLELVLKPYFSALDTDRWRAVCALKFLARISLDGDPKVREVFYRTIKPLIVNLDFVFQRLLPNVSEKDRHMRLGYFYISLIHGGAALEALQAIPFFGAPKDIEEMLDSFLDHMAFGILGSHKG